MREKLHTIACMLVVLVVFTGCKGAGTILKVAFVAAYVGVRVAVAASHSHSQSNEPPPENPQCTCAPVDHGDTWCERNEGEDRCVLQCTSGFVYRDGLCVQAPETAQ